MRTNVYVDEELIQECQELTQLKTKREIIDSALKEFIKL
jgi:Arc/MetJ family transcription regulator